MVMKKQLFKNMDPEALANKNRNSQDKDYLKIRNKLHHVSWDQNKGFLPPICTLDTDIEPQPQVTESVEV